MLFHVYGFRDKKSGAVSNHFISPDPWSKICQNISVSLLNLSQREPNSPFVLFSEDFDLVCVDSFSDDTFVDDPQTTMNISTLLVASRNAFKKAHDQTSPDDEVEDSLGE